MRCIWLEDSEYNKLIFAKSLWPNEHISFSILNVNKPIGESFIQYKKDIYKDINEIYYGYSIYLNNYFKSKEPIWGRKYTVYYKKYNVTTVHEFFSPHLINFF